MALLTSIHGRRFGLDENDAVVSHQKVTGTAVAGTSDSTGTTLANNGVVSVTTSTDDAWVLGNPFVGAKVTLVTGSSSTGIHTISLNSAVAYSTNGIAGSTVVMTGPGAWISLFGQTTARWLLTGKISSTQAAVTS